MPKSLNVETKWNGDKVVSLANDVRKLSAIEIGIVVQGYAVNLAPSDVGRLRKSIIIQSDEQTINSPSGGVVEANDAISKPEKKGDVHVGTNVNYSWYVEFGSGPHKTNDGSDEFIKNITEWCRLHGIDNPWPIILHIRKHGVMMKPFLRPAFDLAKGETLTIMEKNGKQIFKDYLK